MRARALLAALAALGGLTASAWPRACGAADVADAAALPAIEIDQVEITGVFSFTRSEIEDLMEISPGDKLERVKVLRSAENLEEFYRARGYEQASVRTRFSHQKGENGQTESVLDFVVTEGKPTRVAGIHFTPNAVRNESFRKYWKSLEVELAAKAAFQPGDVLDQERLAASRRAVQDVLASEEFVGAKVDEVRVADAEPPVLAPPNAKDTGRWVALDYHVDLGDRVVFGFRGNTVFSRQHLMSLIDETRALGFGKDYVASIRGRIEDEYRSEGYADAQITPYTTENASRQERHVTYVINEGPRVTLEDISFDGNTVYSGDELRSQFFSRASVLLQHGYYVEKDVQKALDLVVEWMKSNGYLSAKIVTVTVLPGTAPRRAGQITSSVRLMVYVYEGDQTLVQSVRFTGLSAFSADEVKDMLGLREGQRLNLFAFSEGLQALKAAYKEKGYLEARIVNEGTEKVIQYSDENRAAEVQLQFSEGPQFKVSNIAVEGLQAVKEIVVRRELEFHEGEVLSESQLNNSQARLRRLGVFSQVVISLHEDPARPDAKRVVVTVQEGTPGVLAGGPGFRNDLGPRAFGQVAYTNFWGLNHTLSLTAAVNRRIDDFHFAEFNTQLTYVYPWFAGYDVTFRPSFSANETEYIEFDALVYGVSLTWEKKLLRSPSVVGSLTYSLSHVQQFHAIDPTNDVFLTLGSITPALQFDTRDNPLSPTTGWYASASWEIATHWMGSQGATPQGVNFPIGYSRFQARVDRLIPLGGGVSWYLSYRAGYEISTEAPQYANPSDPSTQIPITGTIPLIKQFALGGPSSLRGYLEQDLNAFGDNLTGSLSYSNYRTQIDFPLTGALRIGPFLDVANLLVDNSSPLMFFDANLVVGAGFGFHYVTPVGPVNLDLGVKVPVRPLNPLVDHANPQPGEGPTNFYFSIGLI